MPTDESINLAQSILTKQFPNIAGFMDTCLGKTQQFDVFVSCSVFSLSLSP